MPTTITLADIKALNICEDQRERLLRRFPDGVTITCANANEVAAALVDVEIDLWWYASITLTPEELAAHRAAVTTALAAYDAAVAEALGSSNLGRVHHASEVLDSYVARDFCSILARRGAP